MVELNTLGSVIKSTYEAEPNTNAFTDPEKAKLAGLADVATSGDYADLTGKPAIPSGSYEDLIGRPTLSPVATSGAYSDLSGRPDVILRSERGAANGVAPLDAAGMVPMIHLNVSGLSFKGAWNPTTNTPTLVDGTGSVGDFYKASEAGTFNFGNGSFSFNEGDWAIFAGGVWQRIGSNELVQSVNGQLGDVVLDAADVGALPDDYAPTWNDVTDKPSLTNTVNGQSGTVVLNAAGVGALPDTYAPTWDDVTDKPALPTFPAGSVVGPAVPGAYLRPSSGQTLPANAATRRFIGGTPVYDGFAAWNTTDNDYTVPAWAAYARLTAAIDVAVYTGVRVYIDFMHNGNTMGRVYQVSSGTTVFVNGISAIFPVAPGDKLWINVYNTQTSQSTLRGNSNSFLQVELFESMT